MTRPRTLTKYEALRRHVRANPGPWRRRQVEQRFGPRPVARAVRNQDLLTVFPGIVMTPAAVNDALAKIRAVSMWAGPRCAISGMAAALVHGINAGEVTRITVMAPHSFKRSAPPWVRIKRSLHSVATMTVRGITVVDPIEATVQAWEDSHVRRREGTVLDCLRQGGGTITQVRERIDLKPRPRVPATLRRFAHTVQEGSTSYLEHLARRTVLHSPEFAPFVWQHPLRVAGATYTADAYHPGARIAVEFDGSAFHTTRKAVAHDKQRDARLASLGIQTVRFTFDDVAHRPRWCQQILRQVVDARLRDLGAASSSDDARSPATPAGPGGRGRDPTGR